MTETICKKGLCYRKVTASANGETVNITILGVKAPLKSGLYQVEVDAKPSKVVDVKS